MIRVQKWVMAAVVTGVTVSANAATDITAVTASVSGYVDAGIVIGITVLLFSLGRKVVAKVI
jgi:hypothetical protein